MAASVTLGAQGQSPANTPPPDASAPAGVQRAPAPPSAQAKAPSTVTVTGCLQNAPASAATAGSTASKFVLNNASMAARGVTGGAVGTSGTAATSYSLDGDAAKISPHLNHRVEITGEVEVNAGLAPGQGAAAAATPTLKVESVKMLADTCAPSGATGDSGPDRAPQPRPEPQPDLPAPAPPRPQEP